MQTRLSFASPTIVCLVALWSCINSNHSATVVVGGPDSSVDAEGDAAGDGDLTDTNSPPLDSPTTNCTLSDMTDPVALCIEQSVLGFQLMYGYTNHFGVAPSWASTGQYAQGTPHRWQDDLGLAGALGAYECSARVYGNDESSGTFDAVLSDLDSVLMTELMAVPPSGYDGELYFRLRWAQAAYATIDPVTSVSLRGIADTFGEGLQAQAYSVPAMAGSGDAGGSPGGTVIGLHNGDGSVSYAPAQTVMAAAALLDMAVRHWNDADAGTTPATWAATAQQVLSYVQARARDPKTGLYFQSLVTSADPGHDALGTASPTDDALLADTQAWIVLAMARAQDELTTIQDESDAGSQMPDGSAAATPYWAAGSQLVTALTSASLFDGSTTPATAPNPGAFLDGVVASTGDVLTNKETVANAILLGGFHRIADSYPSAPALYELGELRAAMVENMTCNTSFFSLICEAAGPVQQAYLAETSKAYGFASSDLPGADGGLLAGASDYQTQATVAMVEGFTQLWHGATHTANCGP
jgi:hypothetical protein